MNIPETLIKLIGNNDALNSIASSLGLGREQASQAVTASVPTLLAGFSQAASTQQGAEQLAQAAEHSDANLMDNLTSAFSTRGERVAEQGSGMLNSIFGGSGVVSMLPSVLSRFTGIGEGIMGKLLGMLTPVVLGFLGKQAGAAGPSGIANLLSEQKDYIKQALPSGLASSLSSAIPGMGNFLGGAARQGGDLAKSAATTAQTAYQSTYDTARGAARTSTPSTMRWAVPALVALAVLAIIFMWTRKNRVTETTSIPAVAAPQRPVPDSIGAPSRAVSGAAASSSDLVNETSKLITDATSTLGDIARGASAETTVPKLKEINEKLAGMKSMWNTLPESARATAQNGLTPLVSKLEAAAQPVMALPAVGESIRPYITEMLKNLRSLSGAPAAPPSPTL
jgi:hypothetical protein